MLVKVAAFACAVGVGVILGRLIGVAIWRGWYQVQRWRTRRVMRNWVLERIDDDGNPHFVEKGRP